MWYKGLKKELVGIPLNTKPVLWDSSCPLPETQLADLGRRGFVGSFKDYEPVDNLRELVKGKTVVFVCPSPHLRGLKMGKKIDSYDLVVRVNQSFDVPEELWEDYGKRTDILATCLNIHKINALHANMEFAKSLKFILCPMLSMWDIGVVNSFLEFLRVPWHNVCDGYLFKIFKEVGTTCNTGLAGIITLLNYDIKELHITGMTFYNMNTFGDIYFDKYQSEAHKNNNFRLGTDNRPVFQDLRMDIHSQNPQIKYFKKMIEHHYPHKITLDNYLIKNFT